MRTWTPEEVEAQERALEARVSQAAKELDRVKTWHCAELAALRKFRRAKITKAHLIVPSGAALTPSERETP